MSAIFRAIGWRYVIIMLILLPISVTNAKLYSYAQDSLWDIEVINSDYPSIVSANEVFNITIRANATIPAGKIGTINARVSTLIYWDPMPPRVVRLIPKFQNDSEECGEGTHIFDRVFTFSAPDVKRESLVVLSIGAELYEGSDYKHGDGISTEITVLPSDDVAVDTRFKGVIEDAFLLWDFLVFVDITIIEVIEDPGDFWVSGDFVLVYFDFAPNITESNIAVGDYVEICCDYHPDQYPYALMWQPYHYLVLDFRSPDLNNDGKVDMEDIACAALAFGSYRGHKRWDPRADVNNDDEVNIMDLATIAMDFGKTV